MTGRRGFAAMYDAWPPTCFRSTCVRSPVARFSRYVVTCPTFMSAVPPLPTITYSRIAAPDPSAAPALELDRFMHPDAVSTALVRSPAIKIRFIEVLYSFQGGVTDGAEIALPIRKTPPKRIVARSIVTNVSGGFGCAFNVQREFQPTQKAWTRKPLPGHLPPHVGSPCRRIVAIRTHSRPSIEPG